MIYDIIHNDVESLNHCTLCGSKNLHKLSTTQDKNKLVFMATSWCQDCGHVFRSTRPKFDWFLDAWSKRENDTEKVITEQTKDPDKEKRRYDRYKNLALVLQECISNKTVLDVGCGTGAGLVAFVEQGWSAAGLEPDPIRANIGISEHNLNIYTSSIENFRQPHQYNTAILLHVLEHIQEPRQYLQSVMEKIEDNGFIYVEVPELFDFVTFKDSLYLEHMNNFTRKTLQKIGQDIGLTPVKGFATKTHPNGHNHIAVLFQKGNNIKNIDINSSTYGTYIREASLLDSQLVSSAPDQTYGKKLHTVYRKGLSIPEHNPLNFAIKEITNITHTCDYSQIHLTQENTDTFQNKFLLNLS